MAHTTKLTLRLDSGLIGLAKEYAHRQDRSLSQIVGDYFSRLVDEPVTTKRRVAKASQNTVELSPVTLSPVTLSLLGALSPKTTTTKPATEAIPALDPDKAAYRKHLEQKYP